MWGRRCGSGAAKWRLISDAGTMLPPTNPLPQLDTRIVPL